MCEIIASDELYMRWFLESFCRGDRGADCRDIVEFVKNVLCILRGLPRSPNAPSWRHLEILGEQILADMGEQGIF